MSDMLSATKAELDSLNCPYRFSDDEVQAVIDAEEAEWAAFRRRVAAELGPKHQPITEPVPRHWIVERAARRLWDDMRLPFVFVRAEAVERWRAERRSACT